MFGQATEEGVLRLLREKLRKDTVSTILCSILEADKVNSIFTISSETYVVLRSMAPLL